MKGIPTRHQQRESGRTNPSNSQAGLLFEIETTQCVAYADDPPTEDHATPVIWIARMLTCGDGVRGMLIDPKLDEMSDPRI